MEKINPLSIQEIKVEKLFGYYSYSIPLENGSDISQLLIIYGDNGSGKTTILKLLFWILSSRDKSGYKTKIAETKFKRFSVILKNGIEIGALRDGENLIGGFNYYIKQNEEVLFSITFKTNSENAISIEEGTEENAVYKKILEFIKQLNISVFYLSDDRKILNSITSSVHEIEELNNIFVGESDIIGSRIHERINARKKLNEQKLSLNPALERLMDWIRTKVIVDSKTGDKNSQVIFTELIKNVLKQNEATNKPKTKEELITEIETIEESVKPFVKLGLIDGFDSSTIKTSIGQSKTSEQLNSLRTIIAPYIESITAKLKAIEALKDTLNLFLNSINEYFTNKIISFTLNDGFSLHQKGLDGGEILSFNFLSSGEKQLLLLFINTITSADIATIFIIDEPEISLNIKWQRNLIETLLKFSVDKNIQYILSTHSLELLTSNIDKVMKLEEKNG